MKLIARDVEIREIVVLLFDFDVAIGEVFVLFFDLAKSRSDAAILLSQLLHFGAQSVHFFARRAFGFRGRETIAETLVLLEQFLSELLALIEQLEKLLSSGFFAHEQDPTSRI